MEKWSKVGVDAECPLFCVGRWSVARCPLSLAVGLAAGAEKAMICGLGGMVLKSINVGVTGSESAIGL